MNILIDGQTLETEEINRGIGVYFKNVLSEMIKHTAGVVWYITVSSPEPVSRLSPWVAGRLTPVVDESFAPSADYKKEPEYTKKLNEVIEAYHIDCMWNPNPLMTNVLFPDKEIACRFFATVHDLIPYRMPVPSWSESAIREYHRRLDYLKKVHMLCVSDATKLDVNEIIGKEVSADVIYEAADQKLFYRKRMQLNQTSESMVVYTGGFDYRKNIYGAAEAFSIAKNMVKNRKLMFYIVCKYTPSEKEVFENKLRELDIYDDVRLTGFLTDGDLAALYHKADVFFFPSHYEGFGLPLLEAMLGGAYILCADNSSLPELCKNHAIYCDSKDPQNMAEKLAQAVQNAMDEGLDEKQNRQNYALGFSWKKTAKQTYRIFIQNTYKLQKERKKIALVTPWPEQQTGIANFVYRLTPYLNQYFDTDIFIDNTKDNDIRFLPYQYGNSYFINELDDRYKDYDEIIYHMGNSEKHHSGIYRYLKKYSGIVELHDYVMHAFFYHSYYLHGDQETYRQALIDGYGESGKAHFESVQAGRSYPDGDRFPMSESLSHISKKIIVHNTWSYLMLPDKNLKYLIPHPCFDRQDQNTDNIQNAEISVLKKINKKEKEVIIGCFGWINDNKRPDIVIRAVAKLIAWGYRARLVFFGENNSSKVLTVTEQEKMNEHVIITGYIPAEEYTAALNNCDLVINLRYPSMGESSGTLCEAFRQAKAVIVTAVNQYLEYPDEVCWKLPVCKHEYLILAEMIKYLTDHEKVRRQLEKNAKEYADEVLSGDNIARMYTEVIN